MRYGNFSADRRNINNASATARPHRRKNFHYQEEWCPEMHTHRAFKILLLHVFNRADLNDSGIVEKNIDLAIASQNLGHGSLNLRTFKEIALDGEDRASQRRRLGVG